MIDDDSTPEAISDSRHAQRVGKRLNIIRKELETFHVGQDWSQTAVGQRIGLTQNVITRMEHGKGGLTENWFKILNLYAQQGYNLHWIITEDNRHTSKLLIQDTTIGLIREDLLKKIGGLQKGITELHNAVKEVPQEANIGKKLDTAKADDLSFLES